MPSISTTDAGPALDPRTAMGTVHLTVSDRERSRDFYERVLGLRSLDVGRGEVGLANADGRVLIQLHGDSSAPRLDRRATGLFHLAIRLPSRLDLAFALARLSAARWPLDGASDHLVSEALYLSDPDGNGIEIYRDRPRKEWPVRDGQLQMATLPLDLPDLAGELAAATEAQPRIPAGARIGHVHLQVSELERTERFYAGMLGFEVTVRGYPGALFLAAGGYHHHLGLNTWNSVGAQAPQPGAVGLRHYEVLVPDQTALDSVWARADEHAVPIEPADHVVPGAARLHDPSGNALVLRRA